MRIFLSYASERRPLAERLALALEGEGHDVFFDRASLPAGETYDNRIREAIAECDLAVFLVSPESVEAGAYSRTELRRVEERWPHPARKVLPVMVEPCPYDQIPAYLRAVTVLEPAGDPVAETVAAVAELTRGPAVVRRLRRIVAAAALTVVAVAALSAAVFRYRDTRERDDQVAAHLAASATARAQGDFEAAWQRIGEALELVPESEPARQARRELAYEWLHSKPDDATVERLASLLESERDRVSGVAAADLEAHLGWAAGLLPPAAGGSRGDPEKALERTLELDPDNAYAHAMLGLLYLADPDKARAHLEAAAATGRAPALVRQLRFEVLLARPVEKPEAEEALRLADAMRESGEDPPPRFRESLYHLFLDTAPYGWEPARLDVGQALPAERALATYRWLIAGGVHDHVRDTSRYVEARLLEEAGQREEALAIYRDLESELTGFKNRQWREAVEGGVVRLAIPR